MAIAQYLDKRGLKTLVKEINKRTSSVYVVKGSAIYADAAYLASDEKESSITEKGLWQLIDGTWTHIKEVKIGWVYNVTNRFKTDSDFIEGKDHDVEAGTNIVVVAESEDSVKWDLLAMTLNLDPYQTKKLVNVLEIFTDGTDDPITVTAVADADALPDEDEAKKYDVAITEDTSDVYRFDGENWKKIGNQTTVEGSLELLSNVAPNTPISDEEIIAAFTDED